MSEVIDFPPFLKQRLIRNLITICAEVMGEYIQEDDQVRQLKNLYNHFDRLDLRALKNLSDDPEGLQNFIVIQFNSGKVCIACESLSSKGVCKVWQESRSIWSSCKKFTRREDAENPEPKDCA